MPGESKIGYFDAVLGEDENVACGQGAMNQPFRFQIQHSLRQFSKSRCHNKNLTHTVCPRSSDPIYILSYYTKWVTTFWTNSSKSKAKFINGR